MDDRSGISICCIAWIDILLDVGYTGYRGINFFKLFYQKTRTYGILFLYLYIINKRDMREAIKDLIIKAIVITIIMIVIPIAIMYCIKDPLILWPVCIIYATFVALITDIK